MCGGPVRMPEPPVGAPAPDRPVSGRRWHRDLQRLRPTPLAVHIAAGAWATLAASAPRQWGRDIRWALQVDPGSPLEAALPAWPGAQAAAAPEPTPASAAPQPTHRHHI